MAQDILFIDFETYSDKAISYGQTAYTRAKGFRPLIGCYALNEGGVQKVDLTERPLPTLLHSYFADENVRIVAHNADFEASVLEAMGFNIPYSRFYCTRVAAAYLSLPQSLGELSDTLGVTHKKKRGKLEKLAMATFSIKGKQPSEYPELWQTYIDYCEYDVLALRECYNAMPKIPANELRMYQANMKYNKRGVRVDVERAQAVLDCYELAKTTVTAYGSEKFGCDISNQNAVKKLLKLPSLTKDIVTEMLESDSLDIKTREIIELNSLLNQSSIAKLFFLVNAQVDGRIYDSQKFYGAQRTGRYSGKGLQLQNLPRKGFKDLEEYWAKLDRKELNNVRVATEFLNRASAFIRSCILPDEGKQLVSLDFSAIEARVLSWMAGAEGRLEIFRGAGKIYEYTASQLFGITFEEVTKDSDERNIGKAAELAFGYQGGVAAFDRFGKGLLADKGEAEKKRLVGTWRAKNPEIVNFWWGIEKAFKEAFFNGSSEFRMFKLKKIDDSVGILLPSGRYLVYRHVRFSEKYGLTEIRYDTEPNKLWLFKKFLEDNELEDIITPRYLYSLEPKTVYTLGDNLFVKRTSSQLTFLSYDEAGEEHEEFKVTNLIFDLDDTYYSKTKKDLFSPPAEKYMRTSVYGGLITENLTQAVARDLMVKAVDDYEASDLDFAMSFFVHDEINGSAICNTDELKDKFAYIMSSDSYADDFWGKGIPVKAALEVLTRYKK